MICLRTFGLFSILQMSCWRLSQEAVWSCSGSTNSSEVQSIVYAEIGQEASVCFCVATNLEKIAPTVNIHNNSKIYKIDTTKPNNNYTDIFNVNIQPVNKGANVTFEIRNVSLTDFKREFVVEVFARNNTGRDSKNPFKFKFTLKELKDKGSTQIAQNASLEDNILVNETVEEIMVTFTTSSLSSDKNTMLSSLLMTKTTVKPQTTFSSLITSDQKEREAQTNSTGVNVSSIIPDMNLLNESLDLYTDTLKTTKGTDEIKHITETNSLSTHALGSDRFTNQKNTLFVTEVTSLATQVYEQDTHIDQNNVSTKSHVVTISETSKQTLQVEGASLNPTGLTCEILNLVETSYSLAWSFKNQQPCLLVFSSQTAEINLTNECLKHGARPANWTFLNTFKSYIKEQFQRRNMKCADYDYERKRKDNLINIEIWNSILLSQCDRFGVICLSSTGDKDKRTTENIDKDSTTSTTRTSRTTVTSPRTIQLPTIPRQNTIPSEERNLNKTTDQQSVIEIFQADDSKSEISVDNGTNPVYFGVPAALLVIITLVVVIAIIYRRKGTVGKSVGSSLKTEPLGEADDNGQATYANVGDANNIKTKDKSEINNEGPFRLVECDVMEQVDITDQDSGRIISDEGLVYVTVIHTGTPDKVKPKRTSTKKEIAEAEIVEYTTFDFDKSAQLLLTGDSSL